MILVDFAGKLGFSQADAENWRSRLDLRTEYAPTVRGVPRDYSRENVIELAMLAALIKTGCPPRTAVGYAHAAARGAVHGRGRAWLAFPAGDFSQAISTNNPSEENLTEIAAKSPNQAVALIHVGAIVATVDKLFAEKGES